ncbi:MAG: phosphate/phosphite/phosphonate ABC transporter substrate-binding protein [Planctomycetota bacterium]
MRRLRDLRRAQTLTKPWWSRSSWVAALLFAVALAAGCDSETPTGDAAEAAGADTEVAKLVFVFQKQKDPDSLAAAAERVSQRLSQRLGVPVEVVVPAGYSASVQALISEQADVAYVSSLPFLLARRDGGARLILAEQRPDTQGVQRTDYDSLIVVRKDSPLQTMADLKAAASESTFCFTSPTSTSGFVFAMLRLARDGVIAPGQTPDAAFEQVQYGGGYAQALRQVVNGAADACAVSYYTVEGPRADVYLTAEERDQLRVLARTPGVPTHIVCVRKGLPDAWAGKVRDALLELSQQEPDLLADVYGTSSFVTVEEDQHVAAAIDAVQATGVPLQGLNK